ncbi:MAG TPA: TIGR03435 family protein [Bryobacteraceae bacterium]|nr:TIGR03435 family protein [Bryobacteraceae bacterium]
MKSGRDFAGSLAIAVILLASLSLTDAQVLRQAEVKAPARLSFEVASIRPHKGTITFSMDPSIRGRRVTATASTLLDLITTAYGVKYYQISGAPAWAASEHYDLEAKAEDGRSPLTMDQCRQMLQTLLTDRFQLKVHRESEEVPVYALVVGKNGPKLKTMAAEATGGGFVRGSSQGLHIEATKWTMARLASQLSVTAGRPVVDKTGLQGYYAFTLDWFPADRPMPADLDVLDMFQAVQEQLGLKLEPAKGSVEKLVIDHAEKPSEN